MLREVPMVPLQNVRMIVVQFSFSNPEVIPSGIKRRKRETAFEHVARKLQKTGERIIEPTVNCSVAFLDPFYQNGEEIAGQRSLSINLEVRVSRFLPDGSTVVARLKDESGKKVGTPQPLVPDFRLAVVGDTIRLLASDR